ncbi:DNA-directed RNA polymerase, delta subunit [Ligilactobacillus equi DPC 6820]|uniref:Probable DNA-directed RNA polymerase subunit delta n=2 Tax=Ligilactobacillus equi TaxID=137357 RepID=V7HUV4_9LACO|nr:DNA-directed RNA polymerase, delta subunit [Ligilactobacillus equi DPC 6820]
MVEVAHAVLRHEGQTMSFADLTNAIQEYLGKSDAEIRERLSQFYTDLNVDGSFISLGDNTWGLRSWYPFDSIDEALVHSEDDDDTAKKNTKVNAFMDDDAQDDDVIDYDDEDDDDDQEENDVYDDEDDDDNELKDYSRDLEGIDDEDDDLDGGLEDQLSTISDEDAFASEDDE